MNFFPNFLPVFHLERKPYSLFLVFSYYYFLSYSPYFWRDYTAADKASLAFLISELFLNLGLRLKSLIISIGKANKPAPPNKTRKIHPKNDKIATIYTAKEASSYNCLSL